MKQKIEKMDLGLKPFDAAEYLDDEETIAGYLTDALESNDPAQIAEAIGTVARARGMAEVAQSAGVSRESLYRSLSKKGNPELATLIGVMKACGLRLTATSVKLKTVKSPAKSTTTRVRKLKRRGRSPLAA